MNKEQSTIASILIATAQSISPSHEIVIYENVPIRQTYESLVSAPTLPVQCYGNPLIIRNAAKRPVSLDLYEAQTDNGFPFGRLEPGASKEMKLTRPARIIGLDTATGNPILFVEVVDCPKGALGNKKSGAPFRAPDPTSPDKRLTG